MVGTMDALPEAAEAAVAVILVLAAAVWVGGFVAIAVVARVATRTLGTAERIGFFRGLGRSYLVVGGTALVVALVCGGLLLAGRPWGGMVTAIVAVAAALVLATITGVIQARRMTRLRRAALDQADDARAARLRSSARRAGLLRALIGALSAALLVLGVLVSLR